VGFNCRVECIPQPFARSFQLSELVQHDKIASGRNISLNSLRSGESAASLYVATHRPGPLILKNRKPLARSNDAKIPRTAGPIGKAVALGDHAGNAQGRLPTINKQTQRLLYLRARSSTNDAN